MCLYGEHIKASVNQRSFPRFLNIQILDMVLNRIRFRMEEIKYLVITQKKLINQIAKKEDINVETVRRIFSATENIVFDYLSSTTPSENVVVKILNGLSLTGKYIPEKEIHTYDDIKCEERISVKPRVTRYYNRKINNYF